ncbi:hypothetical protein ELQ90_09140 [Labedella phragmitis]|uniref:Uncharacterized protein n=1 Tax=Labedella phragmitis TaxID=2498849 RepID=A0A444PSX8_9MICO|nr:hypothetical protein [Labedella phragmitis]RWZ50970.1 hypothetical protein ELQ90_09140 [Labedella phragmitis]
MAADHWSDFVVIGGLNPDFLAPNAPAPHLGTTDVDILFELGFIHDRDELDFAWLDDALARGGFVPRPGVSGWQWNAVLGDTLVRLDLLCDVLDNVGQPLALPGAHEAAAQNLDGPAAALQQTIDRTLPVPLSVRREIPEAPQEVTIRFTGLGGYIAAKAAAMLARRKPKDSYDLMFVALYNPGGVPAAARAVLNTPSAEYRPEPRIAVEAAMSLLSQPDGLAAGHFARQMQQAGDDEGEDALRQDASIGARKFLELLRAD